MSDNVQQSAEYIADERDVAAVMLAVMTSQRNVFIGASEEQAKAVFAEAKRRLEKFFGAIQFDGSRDAEV